MNLATRRCPLKAFPYQRLFWWERGRRVDDRHYSATQAALPLLQAVWVALYFLQKPLQEFSRKFYFAPEPRNFLLSCLLRFLAYWGYRENIFVFPRVGLFEELLPKPWHPGLRGSLGKLFYDTVITTDSEKAPERFSEFQKYKNVAGFRAEDKCLILSLERFIPHQSPRKLSPKEGGNKGKKIVSLTSTSRENTFSFHVWFCTYRTFVCTGHVT